MPSPQRSGIISKTTSERLVGKADTINTHAAHSDAHLELVSLLHTAGQGEGGGRGGSTLFERGNAVDGQADGQDCHKTSSAEGASKGADLSAAEGASLHQTSINGTMYQAVPTFQVRRNHPCRTINLRRQKGRPADSRGQGQPQRRGEGGSQRCGRRAG